MKTAERLMKMSIEDLKKESAKHWEYVKDVDTIIRFKTMKTR
jgi:hypothetical protein